MYDYYLKRIIQLLRALPRLMRWEDYTSFLQVILGYALVRQFHLSPADWIYIGKVFIVFSPLLYGGLYTLNDVMDAKRDALNSLKKGRPIPHGDITRKRALMVSFVLISSAFLAAVLWGDQKVQTIISIYLVINIFYTFVAKHVPYVELVVNTVTHPLRLVFGAWIAGGLLPKELIMLWFVGIFTGSVLRRIKEYAEGNQHARPVMKYYTKKNLIYIYFVGIFSCFLFSVAFSGVVRQFALMWGIVLSFVYYAYFKSRRFKKLIEFAWR